MKRLTLITLIFLTTNLYANSTWEDPNRLQQVLPSSNGKQILVQSRNLSGNHYEYQLSVISRDSKNINPLTLKQTSPILSIWGPKLNEITYIEKNGNDSKINIFNILTKKSQLLFSIPGQIAALQYSPSFSKLALVLAPASKKTTYYLEGESHPKQILVIYNLNTKQISYPFTENASISSKLRWFNDENKILINTQPSLEYFDSWRGAIGILDITKKIFTPVSINNELNENPVLSTNEKFIAYLTNDLPEKDRPKVFQFKRIALYDIAEKTTTLLPETFDAAPNLIAFGKNDNAILYSEANHGSIILNEMSINPTHTQNKISIQPGIILNPTLNHHADYIGYIAEHAFTPATACTMQLTNFQTFCLSSNTKTMSLNDIEYKTINYPSFDGKNIQGFLITPKNATGPLPTVIVAHGGPTYHSFQEYINQPYSLGSPLVPAALVKKGYAIFMPNIRGSIGYGPDFRKANYNDIGGADFKDLLAGLKYLVAKNITDEHRVGIFGWSYGGFICEYAATQTQAFKAAVCGAAISDWISHDATSEFKAYTSGYFGNQYSRNFNKQNYLLDRSPALQIKYHSTPVLLLHGNSDRAVNFTQALEFYWAYKKAGGITKLAVFTGEDHGFVNHDSIEQGITLTDEWFDKYLKQ